MDPMPHRMKSAPVYMSLPPPCPVYFWEPRPTLPSSARVILPSSARVISLNFPSPTAIRSSVHISPPQLQPGPHIKLWPPECVQHLLPSAARRSPQQVLDDPHWNDPPLLCGQHLLVSGAHVLPQPTLPFAQGNEPCWPKAHVLPSPAQRSPQQVLDDPHWNDPPLLCGQHLLVSGEQILPQPTLPLGQGNAPCLPKKHPLPAPAQTFPQQLLEAPHQNLCPLTFLQVTVLPSSARVILPSSARVILPSSARVISLNFPSPTAIRSSVHISPPQLQPGPHIKLWPAECEQHLLPSPAQRSPQQELVDPQVNDWPLLCGQHLLVSGAHTS